MRLIRHWLAGISVVLSCVAFFLGNGQYKDNAIILVFGVPACLGALGGIVLNHRRRVSKGPEEIALGVSVAVLLQTVICN